MVIIMIFINIKIIHSDMDQMNLTDLIGPVENKDPESSHSRKAILWGQDDLLAQAMEIFLTAGDNWEVIRIPVDRGIDCLIEQAKRIKPNVIILYAGNCVHNTSLPMQLIQDQPELKVVTVSLESNRMQVYSKHNFILREASDLLSIIDDRYLPNHSVQKEVDKGKIND